MPQTSNLGRWQEMPDDLILRYKVTNKFSMFFSALTKKHVIHKKKKTAQHFQATNPEFNSSGSGKTTLSKMWWSPCLSMRTGCWQTLDCPLASHSLKNIGQAFLFFFFFNPSPPPLSSATTHPSIIWINSTLDNACLHIPMRNNHRLVEHVWMLPCPVNLRLTNNGCHCSQWSTGTGLTLSVYQLLRTHYR